jgi:hypothetical protein
MAAAARLPRQFVAWSARQFPRRSLLPTPTTTTRRHNCSCLEPVLCCPCPWCAVRAPSCPPLPVLSHRSPRPTLPASCIPSLARATPTPAPLLSPSCMTWPFAVFLLTRPLSHSCSCALLLLLLLLGTSASARLMFTNTLVMAPNAKTNRRPCLVWTSAPIIAWHLSLPCCSFVVVSPPSPTAQQPQTHTQTQPHASTKQTLPTHFPQSSPPHHLPPLPQPA